MPTNQLNLIDSEKGRITKLNSGEDKKDLRIQKQNKKMTHTWAQLRKLKISKDDYSLN